MSKKPNWTKPFKADPLPALAECGYEPIEFFTRRDLLDEKRMNVKDLWGHNDAERILRRQQPNGRWKYPSKRKNAKEQKAYDWLETYRQVSCLVNKFGFDKRHKAIQDAAKFLLSFQTTEGDLRGIYGNQYSPNYTSQVMEELMKAGYANDRRIIKGLEWLLSMRQDDGGWVIPLRTTGKKTLAAIESGITLPLERTYPFSHFVTGIILRSFTEHPKYRRKKEIKHAGELVASRFFQSDKYDDHRAPYFWEEFSYPFWQTDLLSCLDPLAKLGFTKDDPQIRKALDWFIRKQKKDGSWNLHIVRGADKKSRLWVHLAICRVFKRFYGQKRR